MTDERWTEVERVFHAAAALPRSERDGFLRRSCRDAALRAEVESLLEGYDQPKALLDTPALGSGFELPRLDEDSDPVVGRVIGPFRIEERIAVGGMGTVYRAIRAAGFEQTVAVKVVHRWRDPEGILKRFQVERQTLARLDHPNIARLLDAGMTDDGLLYLVMEFIDGQPIDAWCDRLRLPIVGRLQLFEVVARAVHFAHQNLVVHRDLKPGNVLVNADGIPKLLDFGIAKVIDPEGPDGAARLPGTMTLTLTPGYASPEQVRGEPVTTATDVYSLGVMLYGLLSGQPPHRLTTLRMEEIERVVCHETPRRPSTVVVDADAAAHAKDVAAWRRTTPKRLRQLLQGDLDNITLHCLRKDPERRYASALQLAEELERHRHSRPVAARGDSVWYRTAKFVRRNRLVVGAALVVGLVLAGGTVTTAWQARIAAGERDAARAAQKSASEEATAARAAERYALAEARSASQLAGFLVDALLVSAPRHTEPEISRAASLLDLQVQRVQRQFAAEPHLRANLLDALGSVYVSLGLCNRARGVIEEAAAMRTEQYGADSLEAALSLGSLAELAMGEGRYDEAAEGFRRALELHRRLPLGVHTDVAKAANDLGVALRNLGSRGEAEALHVEALGLRRQQVGERHPLVAESLNNLAAVHLDCGDYAKAVGELRRALAIRSESLGESHPLTAQSRNNLATALKLTADFAGAEPLFRAALEHYRSAAGADPEALARTLANHAEVLSELDRADEGRQALEESLSIRRAHFGDGSLQVAAALAGLARLETRCGEPGRARGRWQEALDIQRRVLPRGHTAIATTLTGFGRMLVDVREAAAAEALLREAVESYRTALPAGHWFTAVAELNLGDSLVQLGRHEEAERLLLGARDFLERERGPDSAELHAARACLLRLYESWGKPDRAAAFRR